MRGVTREIHRYLFNNVEVVTGWEWEKGSHPELDQCSRGLRYLGSLDTLDISDILDIVAAGCEAFAYTPVG